MKPPASEVSAFSDAYTESRRKLLAAAQQRDNARVTSLPNDHRGDNGQTLCTDAIWLGPSDAENVLVHLSGLHGVEGYVGGAVQVDWLRRHHSGLPPKTALVLVHAINPFGMANLRRVNADNIDLNRNALIDHESYEGASDAYRILDPVLNPTAIPRRPNAFYLQAARSLARFGFRAVKQAVAEGQYEFPRGLFYGGDSLAAEIRTLMEWLESQLSAARRIGVIDIHSGLGRWGRDSLLVDVDPESAEFNRLRLAFGSRIAPLSPTGVAYRIRGAFLTALPQTARHATWTCMGQEFGTFKPIRVLRALIEENAWRQWGDDDTHHWSVEGLRSTFCPAAPRWRQAILTRGADLIRQHLQCAADY